MKVLVRGAGVIGLTAARECARRGHRVVIVDPAPERAAAVVAAGMLPPVSEVGYGEESLLLLNLESARRWSDFAAELADDSGADPGYVRSGTVHVARDRDDMAALDRRFEFQSRLGLDVERLNARALRRLEPALGPSVQGGLHTPGDHQVDNRRLLEALGIACSRLGVVVCGQDRPDMSDATDVEVIATGAWAGGLPGLPIRPLKGQILRLRATGRSVVPEHVVWGIDVYVVPRYGEIVVGATVEEKGFDTEITAGAVHELLRDARELVPGLDETELVGCLAGLRPTTPDHGPVIGRLPCGRVVAAGHHRNGLLLAPITATAVADLVDGHDVESLVVPFGPERFS